MSGLFVLLGLALFDPSHSFRESIAPALVVLPIFLLGGYLTAVWHGSTLKRSIPKIGCLLGSRLRVLSAITCSQQLGFNPLNHGLSG